MPRCYRFEGPGPRSRFPRACSRPPRRGRRLAEVRQPEDAEDPDEERSDVLLATSTRGALRWTSRWPRASRATPRERPHRACPGSARCVGERGARAPWVQRAVDCAPRLRQGRHAAPSRVQEECDGQRALGQLVADTAGRRTDAPVKTRRAGSRRRFATRTSRSRRAPSRRGARLQRGRSTCTPRRREPRAHTERRRVLTIGGERLGEEMCEPRLVGLILRRGGEALGPRAHRESSRKNVGAFLVDPLLLGLRTSARPSASTRGAGNQGPRRPRPRPPGPRSGSIAAWTASSPLGSLLAVSAIGFGVVRAESRPRGERAPPRGARRRPRRRAGDARLGPRRVAHAHRLRVRAGMANCAGDGQGPRRQDVTMRGFCSRSTSSTTSTRSSSWRTTCRAARHPRRMTGQVTSR